jgi:hypothetical protein
MSHAQGRRPSEGSQQQRSGTRPTAHGVTGGVDPRIDGEGCSGDDKGAVEAAGLFTGMAIQSDGLSVVLSV